VARRGGEGIDPMKTEGAPKRASQGGAPQKRASRADAVEKRAPQERTAGRASQASAPKRASQAAPQKRAPQPQAEAPEKRTPQPVAQKRASHASRAVSQERSSRTAPQTSQERSSRTAPQASQGRASQAGAPKRTSQAAGAPKRVPQSAAAKRAPQASAQKPSQAEALKRSPQATKQESASVSLLERLGALFSWRGMFIGLAATLLFIIPTVVTRSPVPILVGLLGVGWNIFWLMRLMPSTITSAADVQEFVSENKRARLLLLIGSFMSIILLTISCIPLFPLPEVGVGTWLYLSVLVLVGTGVVAYVSFRTKNWLWRLVAGVGAVVIVAVVGLVSAQFSDGGDFGVLFDKGGWLMGAGITLVSLLALTIFTWWTTKPSTTMPYEGTGRAHVGRQEKTIDEHDSHDNYDRALRQNAAKYSSKNNRIPLVATLVGAAIAGVAILALLMSAHAYHFNKYQFDRAVARPSKVSVFDNKILLGEVLYFGKLNFTDYRGGTFGANIGWQVLAVEEGRMLIIAKDIIECRPYHEGAGEATWEVSSLRQWLNGDFYAGLPAELQERVVSVSLSANDSEEDVAITGGIGYVEDKVFVLTRDEAKRYFQQTNKRASGVHFSKTTLRNPEIHTYLRLNEGKHQWVLRSAGKENATVLVIGAEGDSMYYYPVEGANYGIRPAMWIEL